ncbi:MAG TPA: TRAP transporter large permease subunit, partial [Magnetospirillaceae bacterium]|nr:TRAP transporter large permease subunit [Magnetospirillaceae bacterium]
FYRIPEAVAGAILAVAGNDVFLIYLMIGVVILLAGMFMETASALIILTPIFLPAVQAIGGNLVHFGLVMVIGLAIGMATPPVAINIYVASAITGLPMGRIARPIVPMVLILTMVFFLCVYLPDVVLFLPRLVLGRV